MKIERLNENQIRCTLSKHDLVDREIKLSELAYGTGKAKDLFRDMMNQASYEVGFEADNIPLVIEAIPVSGDCIVLIVTKVNDPDELDTRFSRFSQPQPEDISDFDEDNDDNYDDNDTDTVEYTSANDILDLFKKLSENLLSKDFPATDASDKAASPTTKKTDAEDKVSKTSPKTKELNIIKIFSFKTLTDVTDFAAIISSRYHAKNTLFKDTQKDCYYLVLNKGNHTPELFNMICNMAAEYGQYCKSTYATLTYFNEHLDVIIKNNAIDILSDL